MAWLDIMAAKVIWFVSKLLHSHQFLGFFMVILLAKFEAQTD